MTYNILLYNYSIITSNFNNKINKIFNGYIFNLIYKIRILILEEADSICYFLPVLWLPLVSCITVIPWPTQGDICLFIILFPRDSSLERYFRRVGRKKKRRKDSWKLCPCDAWYSADTAQQNGGYQSILSSSSEKNGVLYDSQTLTIFLLSYSFQFLLFFFSFWLIFAVNIFR